MIKMIAYNYDHVAARIDSSIRKNNGKGFFRVTFSEPNADHFDDEELYLNNLALSVPVLKIGCNPDAYYGETTNKISHIWIYGKGKSIERIKDVISNSNATIGENELLNIMNKIPMYCSESALKNNGIIVQGYSAIIARGLLEFSKKGAIFCPDAAIYYLMGDFFPSMREVFDPHLQEHYGSLLTQEEPEDGNVAESTLERKWGRLYITVNKHDEESEIIFYKNNKNIKYSSKTIKGMLCLEIINNSNEPVSTKELKGKARKLYPVNSRHGESNRTISDAKRTVNNNLKKELGISGNAIVKIQGNRLKFDDDLLRNADLEIA